MKIFKSIKCWIFDLDNTLYSGKTKVFEQVDRKMSKYISEKLQVSVEKARKIQKSYFYEYNTTLNGMIKNHKIDADEFLEFVHDVDLNFLKKDDYLKEQISKLDGKKIIFTNGSKAHASNVTSRIGIEQLFDSVWNGKDGEKGLMPPKGLCNLCSEAEIRESVLYIFHLARKVQSAKKSKLPNNSNL